MISTHRWRKACDASERIVDQIGDFNDEYDGWKNNALMETNAEGNYQVFEGLAKMVELDRVLYREEPCISENKSTNDFLLFKLPVYRMKLCQQKDALSIIESVGSEADDFSLEMEEQCDKEEGFVDIPSQNLKEGVSLVNKRIEADKEKTKIAMMLEENYIDGNLDVESIVSLILQQDCYGGGDEKLREIDRKLHEKGFSNDFGEASGLFVHYEASFSHEGGILSELADQRFLKEKQRRIDAALGHLESFPLCIVDNGGLGKETDKARYSETCGIDFISISSTYKPLKSSDIHIMVKDAEVELEGLTLLYRDDVRRLVTEIVTSFVDCVTQ